MSENSPARSTREPFPASGNGSNGGPFASLGAPKVDQPASAPLPSSVFESEAPTPPMPTSAGPAPQAEHSDVWEAADGSLGTTEDINRLREILLGRQATTVDEVFQMVSDPERRVSQLSADLPDAFKKRSEGDDESFREFVEAVETSVVASIRKSVALDRGKMSEALSPMMGGAIMKYLASFNRQITDSINEKIEIATSPRRLRWLLESRSKGMDYREYVHLKTESYEVDEVCLINLRDLSLIQKVSVYSDIDQISLDPSQASEECRQIQEFLRGQRSAGQPLEFTDDMEIGNKKVIIIHGAVTSLAAIVSGFPTPELEQRLQSFADEMDQIIGRANDPQSDQIQNEITPILENCLIRHMGRDLEGGSWGTRIFFAAVILLSLLALALWGLREYRWSQFTKNVRNTPGVELIDVERGWGGARVIGLHDPLQTENDPVTLLKASGINPDKVNTSFTAFHSLEPQFANQREKAEDVRLQRAVQTALSNLSDRENALKGELAQIRQTEYKQTRFQIENRSMQILRSQFKLPDTFNMSIVDQVLKPDGSLEEPSYSEFLETAPTLTMIDSVDKTNLVDATMVNIQAIKSHAESIYIPFRSGTIFQSAQTMPRVETITKDIKELIAQCKKKGLRPRICLHAIPLYGENSQPNREIDRSRLNTITRELLARGIPSSIIDPPILDDPEKSVPQADRRGIYVRIEFVNDL